MKYFVALLTLIAIYGVVIKKVDTGRCFRYEYIIKTIVIMVIYIVCCILLILHFSIFSISYLSLICFLLIAVLMFFSLKYTIQRFYDLNLSGWYILLKLIPIFSIIITFYLYFKKGNIEINEYDKAINYKKLFKNSHCINIFDNMFIVDNDEYKYEKLLEKYIIKISKYAKNNFFIDYLLNNYSNNEGQIYKTVEIEMNELQKIIEDLHLVVIKNSFFLNIKGFQIFIREEDFKYTMILEKEMNIISKELFDTFDFPGTFYEDEKYIYYNKIHRSDLLKWAKNVA